jgi:anti-sigma regulatory factor (Ser/Thr protein kinase)
MKRKIEFASHPANLSAVRTLVRQFASDAGLPGAEVDLVVLGVDEACANVIRHVYQHEEAHLMGLSCEQLSGSLRFRLRDYGKCNGVPTEWTGRPLDSVQPGGLGLHLIHTAFHEVDYRRKRDGMELVLTRNLKN